MGRAAHTRWRCPIVDAVRAALTDRTRLIWVETPTNPLLSIADIAAIAELGTACGAKVLVDNTFASPALQQPLTLGADIVLHSTTKYIGGHSDVVGGALVTNDEELDAAFGFLQNGAGAVPGTVRCLSDDARTQDVAVADAAAQRERRGGGRVPGGQPSVSRVLYPGLPDHPGHDVAARQMRGFGGMISVRMAGGIEAARQLCSRTGDFHPRRVTGWGGIADRASGCDDARVHGGLATGGARRPGAAVGGHRGCRGL